MFPLIICNSQIFHYLLQICYKKSQNKITEIYSAKLIKYEKLTTEIKQFGISIADYKYEKYF